MLRNQKGFTLVELMVVVAIIGILAAIAIPQYNKFKGNSQLSNVQQMAKQAAKSALSLGSSAQQNPNCAHLSTVVVQVQGTDTLIAVDPGDANNICDRIKLWDTKPAWVNTVAVNGTLNVHSDGTVSGNGRIRVTSNYRYKNQPLGCDYDPMTDKLEDATGHRCNLNF